jgi:hypothetical protein
MIGAPYYYDDANWTQIDHGAAVTVHRNLEAPSQLQFGIWSLSAGKGDNCTFRGVSGGFFAAADRPDVDATNKGVLYGLQSAVYPHVDRDNVPFDDCVGVSIVNQGTACGTDGLYFGRGRGDQSSNPDGRDWANVITVDAHGRALFRATGRYEVGISLGEATVTGPAIKLAAGQAISMGGGVTLFAEDGKLKARTASGKVTVIAD